MSLQVLATIQIRLLEFKFWALSLHERAAHKFDRYGYSTIQAPKTEGYTLTAFLW